jgi:hypothetical protein
MIFFHEGTVLSGSFQDPARVHFHRDYPMMLPLLEAVLYVFRGEVDERLARSFFVALFAFFLLAMQRELRRHASAAISSVVVFLFSLTAFREDFADRDGWTLTSAVADIPLSFFAFVAAVHLWTHLRVGGRHHLILAAALAGACMLLKLEGVVFLVCASTAYFVAAMAMRAGGVTTLRRVLGFVGIALLVGLPYFILRTRLPNFYDEDYSRTLTMGFLPSAAARLSVVLTELLREMTTVSRWNIVWILWPVAVLGSLLLRRGRHGLFFDVLAVLWLGAYIVAYCFSPLHLGYHLQTSASRLISHFMPLVFFRIGLFAAELFPVSSDVDEKQIAGAGGAGD